MIYTWTCILPLLFGSGRLAKINFWFGNFAKSIILYLIQKMYFCEPKKDVYYPNEEGKSKQATSMENTWNICIASHSQSFPRRTFLVEIICRFVPKTQNLRTDKSVSNHEERIYNSICINSHMKYKYCITFGNNIEWLSHLVLLSKVIQNWKFANQKCYFWWYKSTNKFRNYSKLFPN